MRFADAYRHAVGELEVWLRQNRGRTTWPVQRYEEEVERLRGSYLRGVGYVGGPMEDLDVQVADAVDVAALDTWVRVVGAPPREMQWEPDPRVQVIIAEWTVPLPWPEDRR